MNQCARTDSPLPLGISEITSQLSSVSNVFLMSGLAHTCKVSSGGTFLFTLDQFALLLHGREVNEKGARRAWLSWLGGPPDLLPNKIEQKRSFTPSAASSWFKLRRRLVLGAPGLP